MEIRNQGEKNLCIATDKKMITRYKELMKIRYKHKVTDFVFNSEKELENQLSQEQIKVWINAFIESNGIEKMLRIYEGDNDFYEYVLYFMDNNQTTKLLEKYYENEEAYNYLLHFINNRTIINYDFNWFFGKQVRGILGLNW